MLSSIVVSAYRQKIQLLQWQEHIRTSVLALFCMTIVVELYYFSIDSNRIETLFKGSDHLTFLINLTFYLKVIWVIFLFGVFFLRNEQKALYIFMRAFYILAVLFLLDLLLGVFSLHNALSLDSIRVDAYSAYNAGMLSEEAYIELLKLYLYYEYNVYSSFLAKLMLVSYFALCIYLPDRVIDIAKFVGFLLLLLVSYSALELFLGSEE